jgi:glycosyltransferase involved in cell wall biosynthesis
MWRGSLLPSLRRIVSEKSVVLVQNGDDRELLQRLGVDPSGIELIGSSGVDVDTFAPLPEPAGDVPVIGIATRMLAIKGVHHLIEASRLLRNRGVAHKVVLVGAPDPHNPSSIPEQTLRLWGSEPGISWLGHQSDVRKLWEMAHIAVLTSLGGEGVPKTLLEAAACGRPIVATDVPGCREIARAGSNGLLVPPGDAAALADALETLIKSPELRHRFGAEGRAIVEQEFSGDLVGRRTVALYERLTHGNRATDTRAEVEYDGT